MQESGLIIPTSVILAVSAVVIGFVIWRNKKSKKDAQIRPDTSTEKKTELSSATQTTASKPTAPKLSDSDRIKKGMGRTQNFFQQAIDRVFAGSEGSKFYDEVEEAFLTSDIGIEFSEKIVGDLKKKWGMKVPVRTDLKNELSSDLATYLPQDISFEPTQKPHVIMIVGVNGAGKTTTIAKLCQRFIGLNKKVLVGAADTFRAAATAQLKTWIERVGAEGVFQPEGSDPSAVAFDTVQAAASRGVDVCIIDTAGRLHTKTNLMEELKKMKRVVTKAHASAPHDVWLVLDGTQGQNALNQAREFHQHLQLTGLVITKLDGSAKGGAVLSISSELNVPVVYIGVGESPEDLVPFQKSVFIDAILSGI